MKVIAFCSDRSVVSTQALAVWMICAFRGTLYVCLEQPSCSWGFKQAYMKCFISKFKL